jgi:hypothetical protein
MTIDALIEAAIESPLGAEHVRRATESLSVTIHELYDVFSRRVAQQYLLGKISYTSGDAAMNELLGYATAGGGPELSRLAWQVFEAFDQAEYLQLGEPVEEQGEAKTRILLADIAGLRDA